MRYTRTTTNISVLLALLVTINFCSVSCTQQPTYAPAPQEGNAITIDTKDLVPDLPKFYTYHFQGKKISFFVLSINGNISSFLDACASCSTHKQGYRCEDGAVTCRYCNMRFSVYKLEKGLGSCYPIKIEGRLEKGKYRIPVEVLEKEADKF